MSKSKSAAEPRSKGWLLGAVVGALLLAGLTLWQFRAVPQLGDDEEVFKNVDALFTAVTARQQPLLSQVEARLLKLEQEHRLPDESASLLKQVIESAHQGNWQGAAQQLYPFMLSQRREKPTSS